MSETYYDHSI